MTHLKHTFVNRGPLGRIWRRRDHRMTIYSTEQEEADDPAYLELSNIIRAGRGWSVVTTEIESKDFGALIKHMMRAHPEATVRAIGAVLADYRQTDD